MEVSYGFLSVLPLLLMIVLAVITKKVLEPVIPLSYKNLTLPTILVV